MVREEATLGDWAERLEPDMLKRCHGQWVCVLTAMHPNGSFLWALGYALDADAARQAAVANMTEQWFHAFAAGVIAG